MTPDEPRYRCHVCRLELTLDPNAQTLQLSAHY